MLTDVFLYMKKLFSADAPMPEAVIFGVPIHPHYLIEALLLVAIVFLLLQKSYQPEKRPLTKQEIDQLCDEWVPEPLHPPITKEMEVRAPLIESAASTRTIIHGEEVINFATTNYLGLMGDEKIMKACETAVRKYGVGACGPRGFYGTIDVHLDCEDKIAKFMGTADSILYSYGLATAPSAIPAFCKRGDLIIADEGVQWAIQNGLYLSRSTVKLFKHNDMSALEALLENVLKDDRHKKKVLNRRFIVVEAIYQNSGQMAPLDEIVRLKEKYRFRVLIDESNSIGVLGKTGRGLTELFGIQVEKVDIITAAMGHALASVGGFCTGSVKVVDHQRLSGAGYCFSAALPPFVASAAIAAIDIIKERPNLIAELQSKIAFLRKVLVDVPGLFVASHPLSPIVFLQMKESFGSFKEDYKILHKIVDQMLAEESTLLAVTKRSILDKCNLPAGIKILVAAGHTEMELLSLAKGLKRIAASVFEFHSNGQYDFMDY